MIDMANLPDSVWSITVHRRGAFFFALVWIGDDTLPAYEGSDYLDPTTAIAAASCFIGRLLKAAQEGRRR